MSQSILYDNGTGAIGMQLITNDAGDALALGIFTRDRGGADVVLAGTLVPGSIDRDGASFYLSRGIGVAGQGTTEWPLPPARRVQCGSANLTRLHNGGWQLVLSNVDLDAGEIRPSPPAPAINATLHMHPLTS